MTTVTDAHRADTAAGASRPPRRRSPSCASRSTSWTPRSCELIKRRSEVSQRIGAARMAAGGPRIVYSREMAVLDRFADLGAEGRELGMILLRLGRGRLGGR